MTLVDCALIPIEFAPLRRRIRLAVAETLIDDSFLARGCPSNGVIVNAERFCYTEDATGGGRGAASGTSHTGTDRCVLISVVAVVLQYTDPAGEIVPVCVSDGRQLGAKLRSSTSIQRIGEETRTMTAHVRAGAFAGVSAMYPSLLCVASISLMVDAAE
jgi:hypothetical protein